MDDVCENHEDDAKEQSHGDQKQHGRVKTGTDKAMNDGTWSSDHYHKLCQHGESVVGKGFDSF